MGRPSKGSKPMTPAQRQARRRAQFRAMDKALDAILAADTLKDAKALAAAARAGWNERTAPAQIQDTDQDAPT